MEEALNYYNPVTFSINNRIACEPFPANVVEKEFKNGIMIPKQKGALTRLEVVFHGVLPNDKVLLSPGHHVYLRSEHFNANWAKEVFTVNEKRFILVPGSEILIVEPVQG